MPNLYNNVLNTVWKCLFYLGHYMYIEASAPRLRGDIARLLSPRYTDRQDMCVQFYYHMYGNGMGTLNVYTKVNFITQ